MQPNSPSSTQRPRFRPGVFDYSGCGDGTYWSVTGEPVSCSRMEAAQMAKNEGIELVQIDRMPGAWGYTNDWEKYRLPVEEPGEEVDAEAPSGPPMR